MLYALLPIIIGSIYAGYAVTSVLAVNRWARRSPVTTDVDFRPSATILKPVCGVDAEQTENFRSFCLQDYPNFEIVFGALDPQDVAIQIANRLQLELGTNNSRTTISPSEPGLNRKVCNLIGMLPDSQGEIIIIADSDMRVTPDYLQQIIAPFSNPKVGLVTCPYRGEHPLNLPAKMEAFGIGADFIPSSFVAYYFNGYRFAFGSTIAIRRTILDSIDGFTALKDELADDYMLAKYTCNAGFEVVLSRYVVADVIGNEVFSNMSARRLRWAKTSRAMQPGPYLGSIVTHGLVLTSLASVPAIIRGQWLPGIGSIGAVLLVRIVTTIHNLTKTENSRLLGDLYLLPLCDLFSFFLFCASLCSTKITWRGKRFRILRNGSLSEI